MSDSRAAVEQLPLWVEEARRLPIRFAQVREDPELDLEVVRASAPGARIVMVASGGCTAARLLGASTDPRIGHMILVDANPAQLVLSRLKLRWLTHRSPEERLRLLGHVPCDVGWRGREITQDLDDLGEDPSTLGPVDVVASVGPDHAGRYEVLFRELQSLLVPFRSVLEDLLRSTTKGEVQRRILECERTRSALRALEGAWREVMRLDRLVAIFGPEATSNRRQDFSEHFIERTRSALREQAGSENPFLWQVLSGYYPQTSGGVRGAPWITLPPALPAASVEFVEGAMRGFLESLAPGRLDVVHLSNILDWLEPGEATATLDAAARALRPGGLVILRQLNSRLDIRSLEAPVSWDADWSRRLLARDRSFFYRAIHVGRRS